MSTHGMAWNRRTARKPHVIVSTPDPKLARALVADWQVVKDGTLTITAVLPGQTPDECLVFYRISEKPAMTARERARVKPPC